VLIGETTNWYDLAKLAEGGPTAGNTVFAPITMRATVTETTSANEFLSRVYGVLNQQQVTQQLGELLLRLITQTAPAR
jgi:hypothetical protein